jgi:hypothetical protein
MTSILLAVEPIRQDFGLPNRTDIECPSCKDPLVVHQPDERSPDQLLGICMECGTWFLIDEAGGFLIPLPGVEILRDAASSSLATVA